MRTLQVSILLSAAALALAPSIAHAQSVPVSPGAEEPIPRPGYRVQPGVQAAGFIGSGFASTYGIGADARVGLVMPSGLYVGAAVQHLSGRTVGDFTAHGTFAGAEIGYDFLPLRALEVRPYAMAGIGSVRTIAETQLTTELTTTIAIQPGVVALYHVGDAFVGADTHYLLAPAPHALAILAGGGFGF
jgi:hypothetical protein